MPPRALKKLVTEVETPEDLQQWIEKSDQILVGKYNHLRVKD